jgi:hypothetical protein
MAKLTDTQLVILSSASRRDDRGVDLPANVTGEAVCKAVDKLIALGCWKRSALGGRAPFPSAAVRPVMQVIPVLWAFPPLSAVR